MKTHLSAALLAMVLTGGPVFGSQISIGIRIGPPPPPRVVRVIPARPATDFLWVEGYWYPNGRHYKWHPGYWTQPPYAAARWVAPHHDGQMFFNGYWDTEHGHVEHDHRSDKDHERDHRR